MDTCVMLYWDRRSAADALFLNGRLYTTGDLQSIYRRAEKLLPRTLCESYPSPGKHWRDSLQRGHGWYPQRCLWLQDSQRFPSEASAFAETEREIPLQSTHSVRVWVFGENLNQEIPRGLPHIPSTASNSSTASPPTLPLPTSQIEHQPGQTVMDCERNVLSLYWAVSQ